MDYINIVSKEAIEAPPDWCFWLAFGICVIIVCSGLFWSVKNKFATITPVMISGLIGVATELILIICLIHFCSVPTGRYKYGATIDKDNISVTDYEEFLETYKPELKDGIYYWTGEEIDQ